MLPREVVQDALLISYKKIEANIVNQVIGGTLGA